MLEKKIKKSTARDYIIGFFSIVIAAIVSLFAHQLGHIIFGIKFCNLINTNLLNFSSHFSGCFVLLDCSISIAAGPLITITLAIVSNALYIRFPNNLLFGAFAIINSSSRIPTTFLLELEMLVTRYKPTIVNDEQMLIRMINFKDMASATAILFFYLLTQVILFMIAVRTSVGTIRWKVTFIISALLIPIPLRLLLHNYVVKIANFIL